MADMDEYDEDENLEEGETISYEDKLPEVEDTEDGGAVLRMENEEDERRRHYDRR